MSEQRDRWDRLGCILTAAATVIAALFILAFLDSLITYGEVRDLQRRIGQIESEQRQWPTKELDASRINPDDVKVFENKFKCVEWR